LYYQRLCNWNIKDLLTVLLKMENPYSFYYIKESMLCWFYPGMWDSSEGFSVSVGSHCYG
jgi:hypothetical protein